MLQVKENSSKILFILCAILVSIIVTSLRFYQLDLLQAEVYGDINIVHEYMSDVLSGKWPFYFALSSGPLYHYLIAPVLLIFGKNYFAIKIASVVISLIVLFFVFLISRNIFNSWFAITATLLAGCSSWLLIFSRLGNSQMVAPLLAVTAFFLFVKYTETRKEIYIFLSGIVCGLGFFGYPQTFAITPAIFTAIICSIFSRLRLPIKSIVTFSAAVTIMAFPFIIILKSDIINFTSGYIGGKAKTDIPIYLALARNIEKGVLGLFSLSDGNFRSNPAGEPLLTIYSGFLFLVGLIYLYFSKYRAWFLPLFAQVVILQLPSWLVLANSGEVPSASRTLAAAPFIFIFIAAGVWFATQFCEELNFRYRIKFMHFIIPIVIILLVSYQESSRYFGKYIAGLPYKNTPIARYIVDYIKSQPVNAKVHIINCCWESGMPEPKGIEFELPHPENFFHIEHTDELNCDNLQSYDEGSIFIWNYHENIPLPQLEACKDQLMGETKYSEKGLPLFNVARITKVGQYKSSASFPLPTVIPAL